MRPHRSTHKQVPCLGDCLEVFCSAECAQAAWDGYHCLLCPVGRLQGGSAADPKGKGKAAAAPSSSNAVSTGRLKIGCGGSRGSSSKGKKAGGLRPELEEQLRGVRLRRGRLEAFLEHADESNDMFRLAAQVLAMTLVRADRELQRRQQASTSSGSGGADGQVPPHSAAGGAAAAAPPDGRRHNALQHAWLQFAVAEKAPYWKVVGVEDGEDEEEVRASVKELTAESLALLRAAWVETAWPELLDLEVGLLLCRRGVLARLAFGGWRV